MLIGIMNMIVMIKFMIVINRMIITITTKILMSDTDVNIDDNTLVIKKKNLQYGDEYFTRCYDDMILMMRIHDDDYGTLR